MPRTVARFGDGDMSDFTNFRVVYDELTDEVTRARYQFLPDHLRNWYEALDTTPGVSAIVRRLEDGLDLDTWLKAAMQTGGSFAGSSRLDWGSDKETSLGMRLLLFRAAASGKQDISRLGFHFIHVGNNINDNARAFLDQVFSPMARELRRFLEAEAQKPDFGQIPASDRNVTVNHNSKEYTDADEAMAQLEKAIREANDFPSPEERDQREAEVSAARRLLKAVRVNVEMVAALVKPVVVEYVKKVKDGIVAHAASATVTALAVLLGYVFKGLLGF